MRFLPPSLTERTARESAEVKDATGAYRSDMDIIGDFLAECITLKRDAQTTSAALHCFSHSDRRTIYQ
jgi:hypothetical protein